MDESQILEWFRNQLYEQYGIRKELVTPSADLLADLDLDSLDEMNLMFDVEEKFELDIFMAAREEAEEYFHSSTIGEAVRYILIHVSDNTSPIG